MDNERIGELLGDTGRRTCAVCDSPDISSRMILEQKGIPPGLPGYEIGYSHTVVVQCRDCGRVIVEKMSRDAFDFEEAWGDKYEWLVLEKDDASALLDEIDKCPEPMSPTCGCGIHLSLRSSLLYLPMDLSDKALNSGETTRRTKLALQNGLPRIVLDTDEKPQ